MYNEQELTFCVYFAENDTETDTSQMDQVWIDIERPGLATLDRFQFQCPNAGYYHFKFGNEKAWFRSVEVKYHVKWMNSDGEEVEINTVTV